MKKTRKYRRDFLFSTPSFLVGAGSVFNIAGNYFNFNYSSSDIDADSKALLSDWGIIGQDIQIAKEKLEKELTPLNEK
ncbi:MAG: hypothetical protein EKK39_11990 [Sphingobacteriales bacterium]|uniref:hypothetical protein n=1 Tax=Hydrotalea flava TaxID=714549 RepID=UPI00082ECF73|nr:hypothetical protein [Hydrotalea flava]RTL48858.1 MAG: hypothetical protein EKK39_11990 [Sphingobacteriales bacterium]